MDAHACNSRRNTNTMKINLDRFSVVDEEAAFNALVDKFGAEMKAKFKLKLDQGKGGWMDESDPDLMSTLLDGIEVHLAKGGNQMVDVGNLAAMLWNLSYLPIAVEIEKNKH